MPSRLSVVTSRNFQPLASAISRPISLKASMDAPALDDRVAIDGAMSMSLATMPPGTATAQL
jgi:hypothetical protein